LLCAYNKNLRVWWECGRWGVDGFRVLGQRVFFESVVFHPQVHPTTGEINVRRRIPVWKPHDSQLWHLVQLVRELFIKVEVDMPSNSIAAGLCVLKKRPYAAATFPGLLLPLLQKPTDHSNAFHF
jgi:hypothetical protein